MAILIEDTQVERLAQQMAVAGGVTVVEVLREGLLSLAKQRELPAGRAKLRERLAALAREVDAVPPQLPAGIRSEDEILGYDKQGLW